MQSGLYLGLISGTSMDGIDAALVRIEGRDRLQVLHARSFAYETSLRTQLLKVQASAGTIPFATVANLDARVGHAFAKAAASLLRAAGSGAEQVMAIGSHGQTIFHGPEQDPPVTVQIGDPNQLAEAIGIPVVADFRRRDMAAGGQGAPLACVLHAALFSHPNQERAVLNLGGIANLTLLRGAGEVVRGFDTGPANGLMDEWIGFCRGRKLDRDGSWARKGTVRDDLLQRMLDEPYLALPAPKSTGREYFNLDWLRQRMDGSEVNEDVQATLAEFSAVSIAAALERELPGCRRVIACGGGVHNSHLMGRLRTHLRRPVESSADHGLDPDWVEAALLAWLAAARLAGEPGNLPGVTGAKGPRVLGAIYGA